MRLDPPADLIAHALPPRHAAPAPALDRAPLNHHILNDRCRTRDLFCPQGVDPKAPVDFSAYLEKQNRQKPRFALGDASAWGCPEAQPGRPRAADKPNVCPPERAAEGTESAPVRSRTPADAPRIGDVSPTPPTVREERVTIHYEVHRPIPSGMTIDVFA